MVAFGMAHVNIRTSIIWPKTLLWISIGSILQTLLTITVLIFTLDFKMNLYWKSLKRHFLIHSFTIKTNINYSIMIVWQSDMKYRIVWLRWWMNRKNRLKSFSLTIIQWSNSIKPWVRLLNGVWLLIYLLLAKEINPSLEIFLIICCFKDWSRRASMYTKPRNACFIRKFTLLMEGSLIWGRWITIDGVGKSTMKSIFQLKIHDSTNGSIFIFKKWWERVGS